MLEFLSDFKIEYVDITLTVFLLFCIFIYLLKHKKYLFLYAIVVLLITLAFISFKFNLIYLAAILIYLSILLPISFVIIIAPQVRRRLATNKQNQKQGVFVTANQDTKKAIIEAAFALSKTKTGALMTIEKNMSLDQYALKAININSDVTTELLMNIFTPLTPLHDGAVIIKGNKIRCAGAYYTLAQQDHLDKTTGSRHRAALGISEVSDALTVVVSEETGHISLTIEGVIVQISDKEKLSEYLDMFLK